LNEERVEARESIGDKKIDADFGLGGTIGRNAKAIRLGTYFLSN
jgi:hypothetical protein